MEELDLTRKFSLGDQRDMEIKAILSTVYQALQEKGYNPINQIVGYILSEDPTYITNHNNARALIRRVDRDELLDLLDELRAQLPVEIKRAQELLSARDKFVEDAKRDVDRMMRQAELDAKTKVSDSGVRYAAKEKARQLVARAEERCRQLYQVTNEYAEDALARTEEAVQMALVVVKQQRVRFRSASAAKMQEQRDKLDGRTPPQEDGGEE